MPQEINGQAAAEGEAVEAQDPKAGEGATAPQDPQPQARPQDPEQGEGERPQDPEAGEGNTVTRHQYERDIQRRDRRIAELEAQLAASGQGAKTAEERIAELEAKFAESESRLADERVNTALTAAGCIDAKAAKARLDEFDGDVAALKGAAPYLFKSEAQAPARTSTGGEKAGKARMTRAEILKVKDPQERRRLIAENLGEFE